ncbi:MULTISPECIES: hypothetical protein [Flavobacterium]|uniref:hypothetical protein n=1 Tax=Flavobacterium TaxID=237 RepID=UPI001FCB7F54|nr:MULTISPECIES: hypothetical protein [Flavobacterium]UOK42599.1 hypothetical protein LZF87_00325 [Flavobacterium enshiense]
MKKIYTLVILIIVLCSQVSVWSQVGIGTTSPAGALDVASTNDGLLIPRIALIARNNAAPLTAPTVSELIYNTATVGGANGVSPGYYYWNGSLWVALSTGNNSDWSLTGNSGTTAGTNFIGTTDAQDFRIKTGNNNRWNISNTNNGQLQSYSLGTAALPNYSYQNDPNTGIFSPAANSLAISTNGLEKVRVLSNGNVGIGITNPSAKLTLAAGAAAASNAPLKFTSGINLTTPENGTVEYNGTNYFVTSGGTRYTLARTLTNRQGLNFPNTAEGENSDLTITVIGAALGDVVVLGVPNNAMLVRGTYQAWVSATDTITIRFSVASNNDADLSDSLNPPAGQFRVSVLRY